MRVVIRSAGVVFVAIVAAVLLALTTTTSALAATALMLGGIGASVLPDSVMSRVLADPGGNGAYTGYDSVTPSIWAPARGTPSVWQRENVVWPAQLGALGESVMVGKNTLYTKILTTPGPKTVVGMSAGALPVEEVLRQLANDPTAPPKSELNFVVIADSSRQPFFTGSGGALTTLLGYIFQAPAETQYDIIVVTSEYDGFADLPDRLWNGLAVANAMVGTIFLHNATFFADLSTVPDENITVTTNSKGGVTTSYLIPTERLPLVQLLPSLAPIEASLKQQVDAGYSRNDPPAVTRSTAIDLTTETDVESRTLTVDPPVGSLTEPVEAPAQSRQGPADATDVLAEPTAEAPAQTDEGLNTAPEAVSNRVTDLTDGNKVSPSTSAGTTQLSSGWKPGDGIRAATEAISQLFSGKPASTSTTTTAPTSDTSTNTGSETSSSTPSSPGSGSTP